MAIEGQETDRLLNDLVMARQGLIVDTPLKPVSGDSDRMLNSDDGDFIEVKVEPPQSEPLLEEPAQPKDEKLEEAFTEFRRRIDGASSFPPLKS